MSLFEDMEEAVSQAGQAAGPSVVRIGQGAGRGAGFVLAKDVVVTNAHNLRDRTTTVSFSDGRQVQGEVAGVDADGDLVALRVDTAGVAPLTWAEDVDGLRPGRIVFALSRPAGAGARITSGAVSSVDRAFRGPRGRLIEGVIEHTAPLGRGSSGGPVVDRQARLVAVNTHRLGDGFYAAQPATPALRERLERLSEGHSPTTRRLGVALAPAVAARRLRAAVGLPARDGLLVRGVEDGGPAAAAGLQRGDLIVAAGGQPVATHDDLLGALDGVGEEGTLTLGVVRGVEELTLTARFEAPASEAPASEV